MLGLGIRQTLFVCCSASITGLSYLLSYTYIVILSRFYEYTPFYVSIGAVVEWAACALLAHLITIIYDRVRRDTLAAFLVGLHTAIFLCLVVGAVYVDRTQRDLTTFWLMLATLTEIIIKLSMEMFQVATIRDWIIEVSENDKELLVKSNILYYILAVTIPSMMTLGGNYLFDFGLSVTGIVLTLGATAILLQLLALTVIIFIMGPLRSNLELAPPRIHLIPVSQIADNIRYFFSQSAWELSLGLDVESFGLISFGLFMRMFLAQKGVTPYTITVLISVQAGAAVVSALMSPFIRKVCDGGKVITLCTAGKVLFSALFLFLCARQHYSEELGEEVVIITHDSIFIVLDGEGHNSWYMMGVVVFCAGLLAIFSQLDALFSNQLIQESIPVPERGRYAGTEFSAKYVFTFAKSMAILSISTNETLLLVLVVLTLFCEIIKICLSVKYVLKVRDMAAGSHEYQLQNKRLLDEGKSKMGYQ